MIDSKGLIKWLRGIDKKLQREIIIVAVGGTAMTLLGIKPSTIDIDFCVSSSDKRMLEQNLDGKFKVDIFIDGFIFSEQLPDDYAEKSTVILELKNITLKALSPVDIVITKCARLNARDEEDIKSLAKKINRSELLERFESVIGTYSGRSENYRKNFEYILRMHFPEK